MPQLDFREALSTPEQNVLPSSPSVAVLAVAAPSVQTSPLSFLRGFRLSRSAWANIVGGVGGDLVGVGGVGGIGSGLGGVGGLGADHH
jgi:hypothetical protein